MLHRHPRRTRAACCQDEEAGLIRSLAGRALHQGCVKGPPPRCRRQQRCRGQQPASPLACASVTMSPSTAAPSSRSLCRVQQFLPCALSGSAGGKVRARRAGRSGLARTHSLPQMGVHPQEDRGMIDASLARRSQAGRLSCGGIVTHVPHALHLPDQVVVVVPAVHAAEQPAWGAAGQGVGRAAPLRAAQAQAAATPGPTPAARVKARRADQGAGSRSVCVCVCGGGPLTWRRTGCPPMRGRPRCWPSWCSSCRTRWRRRSMR